MNAGNSDDLCLYDRHAWVATLITEYIDEQVASISARWSISDDTT